MWYNNFKSAACAAARTSCADALLRMGLKYCIAENRGICSFYAEKGGLLVGFEDAGAPEL